MARTTLTVQESTRKGVQLTLGAANGASDHPRAITFGKDLFAYWRTELEGMRVFRLP